MVGCRHTFCTNAAKRGISVETLKYLMGHTDISVTSNVYTHLKLEDAQKEIERRESIEKEMKSVLGKEIKGIGKSTDEYESGLYLDLDSFYLPRYGKICNFMLG